MANIVQILTGSFVFLFDLISFCLAIAAEQHRNKATIEYNETGQFYYCKYDSDVSSTYGAGAFVTLLIAQCISMGVTRCFCGQKTQPSGGNKACAVISFLLLWLCWSIAAICLLAGANRNSIHTKTQSVNIKSIPLTCDNMRKGVFGAGAAFAFFTIFCHISYYVTVSKVRQAGNIGWQGAGSGGPGTGGVGRSPFPAGSPYAL